MRLGIKHVALVGGTAPNNVYSEQVFRKSLEPNLEKLELINLTKLSMEEILTRVGSLPPDTIVLYAAISVLRADGSVRWIASRGRLQQAKAGKPSGMMGVSVDISERKETEEALRRNEQDLSKLTGRIIYAQEEELRRLSRELHDDLTQRLAALALDAALIEKELNPLQPRAVQSLKDLRANLSEVADEVHDLSRQLHPYPPFDRRQRDRIRPPRGKKEGRHRSCQYARTSAARQRHHIL
jgi:signal transduction histidine kinase